MPVTFDNFGSSAVGAATSIALTFTAGANAVMIAVSHNVNNVSVSTMAYNGVALTRYISNNDRPVEVWVLTAPASGSNVLSCLWKGVASVGVAVCTYTNAKNVAPFGTGISGTATTVAAVNYSVSSSSTDLVWAGFCILAGTQNITWNNGTVRGSFSNGTTLKMTVGDIAGAASITISATTAATTSWKMFAIPIVFSAAAAVTNPFTLAQMGCGM